MHDFDLDEYLQNPIKCYCSHLRYNPLWGWSEYIPSKDHLQRTKIREPQFNNKGFRWRRVWRYQRGNQKP